MHRSYCLTLFIVSCVQVLVDFGRDSFWFHSANDVSCIRAARERVTPVKAPQEPKSQTLGLPARAPVESAKERTFCRDDLVVAFNHRLKNWEESQIIDTKGHGESFAVRIRPMCEATSRRDRWLIVADRAQDLQHFDAFVRAQHESTKEAQEERRREENFAASLKERGLRVAQMGGDGSCLYRSVSFLIFGTEERHLEVRASCFAHMRAHRAHFATYVFGDFETVR